MIDLPDRVTIVEVGPRDGLQNEAKILPTSDKVRLIEALAQTGITRLEVTSFVNPKLIPQLADGPLVANLIKLPSTARALALVPNMRGYEQARQAGLKEIAFFLSASESHSRKNINKSIAEALAVLTEIAAVAHKERCRLRCYLSVVFVCPFEGKVSHEEVLRITSRLFALGVDEVSLGDTIGAATPKDVFELISLLRQTVPIEKLALHFHDTYGMALANVLSGLACGITTFDASLGGLGGCPYAPGASGNLATEDLVYMLEGMGIVTGIDLNKLIDCGELAEKMLSKKLPGRYLQAALSKRGNVSVPDEELDSRS